MSECECVSECGMLCEWEQAARGACFEHVQNFNNIKAKRPSLLPFFCSFLGGWLGAGGEGKGRGGKGCLPIKLLTISFIQFCHDELNCIFNFGFYDIFQCVHTAIGNFNDFI